MTEITVVYDGRRPIALDAKGHSGYAEKGGDIVCAGVSVLLQTLLYGFEQVLTSNSFKSFVDKRETVMSMDWRFTPLNESSLLVEAIIGSLKNIARDYPEHVRILEVQVNEQDF